MRVAAELWGLSTRTLTYKVVAGRIPGVIKKGSLWFITATAEKPEDRRKYKTKKGQGG